MEDHLTLDDDLADVQDVREVGKANAVITELNTRAAQAKTVRFASGAIGVITVCLGLYLYFAQEGGDAVSTGEAVGVVVEGVLFILFGVFVTRKPLLCASLALGFYVLNLVIGFMEDGGVGFSGLAIKGLILYYLGRAVYASIQLPKLRAKLRDLGVSKVHLQPSERLESVAELAR